MATELKTITVQPDSDLGRLLKRAAEESLLVETDGILYRVSREVDDPFAGYDPDGVEEALRRSAGAFAGMDVEAFKAEVRQQRAQDSQGRPG